MDQVQRERSSSATRQHLSRSSSSSPWPESTGLGLALDPNSNSNDQSSVPTNFSDFLNSQQSQDFNEQFKLESSFAAQGTANTYTQDLLGANIPSTFQDGDFSLFPTSNDQGEQYDPALFINDIQDNPSFNMSSSQPHTPTPPNLLQPNSGSPSSAHQSPSFGQTQFQQHSSPSHSRNASLGPESAAFPQGQNHIDWAMMAPQFQGHRRTPSEYSDVSASSVAHSPNLLHHDNFEAGEAGHSPMQHPQDSNLYNEVLGIGSFSLSDPQVARGTSPGRGFSPAHSPAISPRLAPSSRPNNMNPSNHYLLGMNNGFPQQRNSMYSSVKQESFPQIQANVVSLDMGQATQMVPPEINVEFAPTSRQNAFDAPKSSFDQDALTPPDRGRMC